MLDIGERERRWRSFPSEQRHRAHRTRRNRNRSHCEEFLFDNKKEKKINIVSTILIIITLF